MPETPLEKIVNSPAQIQFGLDKSDTISIKCMVCDYKFACWGACPKHRFIKDESDEKEDLNYLCPSYKEFFKHINWPMTIMAALFNQGRAPADIMTLLNKKHMNLREIFPQIGRNDPCPCGSGLKFKKCHGRLN